MSCLRAPAPIMNQPNIDAIVSQVEQALKDSDVPRAFEVVAPLVADGRLEQDPRIARLWLTLLRCQPNRAGLVSDVARIAARWPDDAELQLAGCDALIRAAELLGPDVPVP